MVIVQKAFEIVRLSQWAESFVSKEKNQIIFEIPKEETAELNKYFIESGINVSAVIPTRSLEDYFLKITEAG